MANISTATLLQELLAAIKANGVQAHQDSLVEQTKLDTVNANLKDLIQSQQAAADIELSGTVDQPVKQGSEKTNG